MKGKAEDKESSLLKIPSKIDPKNLCRKKPINPDTKYDYVYGKLVAVFTIEVCTGC